MPKDKKDVYDFDYEEKEGSAMSEALNDGTSPMVEEPKVQEAPKKAKYRYFCPACTGIAFYSDKKEKRGAVVCANCGKEIVADKLENYIEL